MNRWSRRRLIRFWLGYWAATGWFFYAMDTAGNPLCDGVREAFRLDTPAGRAAFIIAYPAGSAVLFRHVLKPEALGSPRLR